MTATAANLIDRCRQHGVTLYLDGDQLRFRGPRGALTPELRQAVAQHRAEVVRLLLRPAGQDTPPPPQRFRPSYLPCSCPTATCWPCCNRPCEVCGKPTGSAFIRQCIRCGNAAGPN